MASVYLGTVSHKQAKKRRRERRDIQRLLAEQLRLLRKRCDDFDAGDWGEAPDIATRLRVIFSQGKKSSSPSLLQSLDARKVPVLTTCEPREDSENILEVIGNELFSQTMAKDENGLRYELAPMFGNGSYRAEIPAHRWREGIVQIVSDEATETKHVYRRMDVIKNIAEKDGGAHVAEMIPEAHDVLTRPGGIITITIGYEANTREVPIEGVHLAMLRQMAYEVLNSPALLALSDPKKT
jgi:hypothetical protein